MLRVFNVEVRTKLVDFFFFQAEDGIRDYKVTGVQTCALPISLRVVHPDAAHPLLERLGARRGGPADLLESAALRDAVEHSLDDVESGVDISEIGRASCRGRV